MFLSDKNNIKEVLLFPAMKPDENDARTSSVFRAAKALAAQTRASEAKSLAHRGGVLLLLLQRRQPLRLSQQHIVGSGSTSAAASISAPALVAPELAALDAKLAGRSFFGGSHPSADRCQIVRDRERSCCQWHGCCSDCSLIAPCSSWMVWHCQPVCT